MDLSKLSDEKIALHMQKNSGEGIDQIIDRYQKKLVRYATGIFKDEDKAEDIVQETFIAVYKNINSFDTSRKFSSWIYRIVHNRAINELRKNNLFFSLSEAFDVPDKKNSAESIEQEIDAKKTKEMLLKKIENLPLKYKEVVVLRYIEDRSYEEISDILKIPKNTVGVRIKRSLEKIKKNLNINVKDYL